MSSRNYRAGKWLPDQPGHDWDAKPATVKGVSSKPGNEKTMSLDELNEKNLNSRFQIKEQHQRSNSAQEKANGVGD